MKEPYFSLHQLKTNQAHLVSNKGWTGGERAGIYDSEGGGKSNRFNKKDKKNAKISRLEIITSLHPRIYSKINAS